jgi:hypothetical protein
MSNIIKRRYEKLRKEFKRDIYEKVKDNPAFAMLIVQTFRAKKHRNHITAVWSLLGHNHKEAYRDYSVKLFGKHLTGSDEIMHSLYFADREIHQKYVSKKIPECFLMGDALAIAYYVLRQ